MLEGRLAEIYEHLWLMSENKKPRVRVMYRPANAFKAEYSGAAAIFMTSLGGRDHPGIWVQRDQPPAAQNKHDTSGATVSELVSLAHERGHEQSWRDGTYEPMSMPEERRAWTHAEALLRSLGFDAWDVFEEHKAISLGEHERRGTTG